MTNLALSIRKWSARYVAIILLATVLSITAASCNNTNKPVTKITYAMPITVAAIPAYVALEKGFWKEEGLDVQAQMFPSGRQALDALLSKSAEVMSVSETPLMHAILQGNKIYIVTTVTQHQEVKLIARRVTSFRMEALPRISRAQDMDVLSSMATIAGYHAAVLAAYRLPRLFPLLMTAAGVRGGSPPRISAPVIRSRLCNTM